MKRKDSRVARALFSFPIFGSLPTYIFLSFLSLLFLLVTIIDIPPSPLPFQFSQLKGKVQKILTWRWQEPPVEDEEEKKEREDRRKKEDEEYESMSDEEKKKMDSWRNKQKELEEGR